MVAIGTATDIVAFKSIPKPDNFSQRSNGLIAFEENGISEVKLGSLKEETITRIANAFERDEEIFNRTTRSFNIKKMREISWRGYFNKLGLYSAAIPNTLEAIQAGASRLGVHDLVGHEREDQLHEWDIEQRNKWKEEFDDGKKLIDYVTKFVVEVRFRKKYPFVFKDHGKGELIPRELLKISRMEDEFADVAPGGLQNSQLKTMGAIQHRYPEGFGWGDNQIKPGEIKSNAKYEGNEGEKNFARGFAYCLNKAGLGKFAPENNPPLIFTKSEFLQWKNKNLQNWDKFFKDSNTIYNNISFAYDKLCDNSIITAFETLLGAVDKGTNCFGKSDISISDVKKAQATPVKTKISTSLLGSNGFYIRTNTNKKETLYPEAGKHLKELLTSKGIPLDSQKKNSLYKSLGVVILSNWIKKDIKEENSLSILESLLLAKETNGDYLLPEHELRILFKTLREDIIDETSLDAITKVSLKSIIEDLLIKGTANRNNIRDILIPAMEADNSNTSSESNLKTLNLLLENVYSVLIKQTPKTLIKSFSAKLDIVGRADLCKIDWSRNFRLGESDLVGSNKEKQIHPWDFKWDGMWEHIDTNGKKLIDYITEFVIDVRLRKKHPKMFEENGNGKIILDKLRKFDVNELSDEYNLIAPNCLKLSGLNCVEALKRRHPEFFGWDKNKIKPDEMTYRNMWNKSNNKEVFALEFAYCLSESGLGKFNPDKTPHLEFSRADFLNWKEKPKNWRDFFYNSRAICKNVSNGFLVLSNGNIITAFEMLLGPVDERTGCFGDSDISRADIKSKKLLSVEFTDSKTCIIEINTPGDSTNDEQNLTDPISLTINIDNKMHSPENDKLPTLEELNQIEEQLSSENEDFTYTESKGRVTDPADIFFKEMREIPLLKREEEIELAKAIELARIFEPTEETGNSDLNDIDTDTVEQIISSGIEATNKLVEGNLRLVVSIARRYQNRGLSLQDLIQEGSIGLIRATKKYDYKLGYKFGTYATWWIRQGITRALTDKSKTVRIPAHIVQAISNLNKASKKLRDESEKNREPTIDEIAVEMGISVEKVKEIITANKRYTSLQTQGNDDAMEFGNILEDEKAPNPYKEALNSFLKGDINKVLKSLTQREREVIVLRFGLDGNGPRTLDEVAKIFGVTRERIRQIEARAMLKLQKPDRKEKLEGHL